MFSYLQLAIGAYLLYCAVTGKGKVFDNDFLKVPREEYVKKMRIMAGISGTILGLSSLLETMGLILPATPLGWISWGLGLASIIPLMVYSSKSTDKEAAKAHQSTAKGMPAKKEDRLRAAFVFDDEEETAKPEDSGETGN